MITSLMQNAEPLPGYRLIERLGRGGYGEVWKAEAPGGLFKAIKFVYGDLESSGDDNKSAEQELKALHRVKTIRHPFILSIERFDIVEGQLMIVMELADRNLEDRFQECRSQGLPGVPKEELLRYMDEASEALDLMNGHYQIQHLDIKPQNLFLVHNHVKVADFGLAKDFEGIRATVTGGVTPVYAAPEAFEGWVSRFSDQYSLAIVYQELLTGFRPFSGANARQLMMQHLSMKPDVSSLPANERPVIARALSKKPEDRFPTCGDFVKAIRECASTTSLPLQTQPTDYPAEETAHTVPNLKQSQVKVTPAAQHSSAKMSPTLRPPGLKEMPRLLTPGHTAGQTAQSSVSRQPPVSKITEQNPFGLHPAPIGKLGSAPPEKEGTGVLFPVYLVGVGSMGLQVLQQLRSALYDQFNRESFPHVKWLFIDTDPVTIHAATSATKKEALETNEVYHARMHRPGHYLKKDQLSPLDAWMSTEILHRMPREPATEGIRCLGRLALLDHLAPLKQKIREDLGAFISNDALMEADRLTGLGIRSNRPRVYIASSLAGGTGSGMLIDLAYLIRNVLRDHGFSRRQISGLLISPPVDRSKSKKLAIANACATMMELMHFSAAPNQYETRYDHRPSAVKEHEKPFDRCVLLSLQRTPSASTQDASMRGACLLVQEAFTPLGRCIDSARATYRAAYPSRDLTIQSFGMYRFSWPRQRLLETIAKRVAASTVLGWTSTDSAPLQPRVEKWLEEQWGVHQLDPEALKSTLCTAITKIIGDRPESWMDTELQRILPSNKLDPSKIAGSLERLFEFVGKPGSEEKSSSSTLESAIESVSKAISKESDVKFAMMAVHFIEQPLFRLAGAELAIRLCTERLNKSIDERVQSGSQDGIEIEEKYQRMLELIGSISNSEFPKNDVRHVQAAIEFLNLMQLWFEKRLNYVLGQASIAIYRQMLSNVPQYMREITSCRKRLTEAAGHLNKLAEQSSDLSSMYDQPILPAECRNLLEAADGFIAALSDHAREEFDEAVQVKIRRQFDAIVRVCLTFEESGPAFEELLVEEARAFIESRIGRHTPAELLIQDGSEMQAAQRNLLMAYEKSAPEAFGPPASDKSQSFVLGISTDESGRRLNHMLQDLMPELNVIGAPCENEIIFYRECHDIPLTNLPQMGMLANEILKEVRAVDRIDAHARADVHWTRMASGGIPTLKD